MRIHAILFDLECQPPASRQLIAWIDERGNGKYCQHAHPSKALLEAEPGHTIVHQRKQYIVKRVKPYRTTECRSETQYPWVKSGREYLRRG